MPGEDRPFNFQMHVVSSILFVIAYWKRSHIASTLLCKSVLHLQLQWVCLFFPPTPLSPSLHDSRDRKTDRRTITNNLHLCISRTPHAVALQNSIHIHIQAHRMCLSRQAPILKNNIVPCGPSDGANIFGRVPNCVGCVGELEHNSFIHRLHDSWNDDPTAEHLHAFTSTFCYFKYVSRAMTCGG